MTVIRPEVPIIQYGAIDMPALKKTEYFGEIIWSAFQKGPSDFTNIFEPVGFSKPSGSNIFVEALGPLQQQQQQ